MIHMLRVWPLPAIPRFSPDIYDAGAPYLAATENSYFISIYFSILANLLFRVLACASQRVKRLLLVDLLVTLCSYSFRRESN